MSSHLENGGTIAQDRLKSWYGIELFPEVLNSIAQGAQGLLPLSLEQVQDMLPSSTQDLILSLSTIARQLPSISDQLITWTIEEMAARNLVERFGRPQSVFAIPVFLGLIRDTEDAGEVKDLAIRLTRRLESFRYRLSMLKFVVAQELETVETEVQLHREAQAKVDEFNSAGSYTQKFAENGRGKLNQSLRAARTKLRQLVAQARNLDQTFANVWSQANDAETILFQRSQVEQVRLGAV